MDYKELNKALTILDWSDKEAFEKIGVAQRTMYNYSKGLRSIPLVVQKSIETHLLLKQIRDMIS